MTTNKNNTVTKVKISRTISFKTQLYGLIFCLCLSGVVTNLLLNINYTHDFLTEQMGIHAQDATTQLGLAISPYINEDPIIVETIMSAMFDSGYYQSMIFTPTNGPVIAFTNPETVENVPDWFIKLLNITPQSRNSDVSDGWLVAGNIEVTPHTGNSYEQLWRYSKKQLTFAGVLSLMAFIISFLIIKALLVPLQLLTKQAEAVAHKHYRPLKLTTVTYEVRTLGAAFNLMVNNTNKTVSSLLKQSEKLINENIKDSLTQLGNRKAFDKKWRSIFTNPEQHSGTVKATLFTLPSLTHINNKFNYLAGDEYVTDVANTLTSLLSSELHNDTPLLFRINGGDFILLLDVTSVQYQLFIAQLQFAFDNKCTDKYSLGYVHSSAIDIDESYEIKHVLSRLDFAHQANQAQTTPLIKNISLAPLPQGLFNITKLDDTTAQTLIEPINDASEFSLSNSEWKEVLLFFIDKPEYITLQFQPVQQIDNEIQVYNELFCRFVYQEKALNNAHLFMMAEKFDLALELNKAIISQSLHITRAYQHQQFAINLSDICFNDPEFKLWLIDVLSQLQQSNVADNAAIIFELHENTVIKNPIGVRDFINDITALNTQFSIKHFGLTAKSFKFLRNLNVSYIKLDRSFNTDDLPSSLGNEIDYLNENSLIINTIVQLCHALGIKIIGSMIENQATIDMLKKHSINYFQGRHIQTLQTIDLERNLILDVKFQLEM